MRAHPKWLGLLVLVRNNAAAGAAASFAASASDQSSDAPAVAAGSETSAEAAVAGRESGATNHGAEPDGAGAGTGQAFDGAEPGVEHRRSARPSRCSSLHRPCVQRPSTGGRSSVLRACTDDLHMEGSYWLVKVLSCSFQVEEDTVHATDEFEKGWTVVEAQYYSLEQESPRGYRLLPEKSDTLW